MFISKVPAMALIGVAFSISGCKQQKEDPAAIRKDAVPPVPAIHPGKAGAPEEGQGLTATPGREYGRGVDDRLFRRYVDKPALVARSVEKTD